MTYTMFGKPLGPVGFGLMSLASPANPQSDEQIFAAIKAALDSGANYLNGGEFYGPPDRNSLVMLNKYLQKYPEDGERIVLNIKGGLGEHLKPRGDKEGISRSIDNCLQTLGAGGRIHQFEAARRDSKTPYEDTLATIQSYVDAGKIDGISCSEIGPETLRKVVQKFKITALEIELSLFRVDPIHNGLLAICAEHDIPVVAYSPLGRGFLTGEIRSPDDIPLNDFRRHIPQFSPENFDTNLKLVHHVQALAKKRGCTPAQVAIGWLLSLSKRPGMPKIIPIPGSTNPDRIRQNSTVVELSDEELAEIETFLQQFSPKGNRYPDFLMADLDG